MPTIKIDDKEYDVDKLSPQAKAQLQNIKFVDMEIERMTALIAVMQTARAGYLKALQQALFVTPSTEHGDTIKLG